MYNLIRGRGLTYSVSMSSSVTEGRMRVKFTRSSQLRDGIQCCFGLLMPETDNCILLRIVNIWPQVLKHQTALN